MQTKLVRYNKNMLQLQTSLLNRPVFSLRTGAVVATALEPIINPNNLKVEGFYCLDSVDRKKRLILVTQDIREVIPEGFVVNDHDVLVEPGELVRLKQLIDIHFQLVGKKVVTQSGQHIGKVSDYATETSSMFIKKFYVSQSILKSFSGGNLGIDRTQIIEISDKKITIQDLNQKVPAGAKAWAS